jgi:2-polyprenyl-3-methyl-5-hydroxy-6-metoxy-1,4-benzoquinol methylase
MITPIPESLRVILSDLRLRYPAFAKIPSSYVELLAKDYGAPYAKDAEEIVNLVRFAVGERERDVTELVDDYIDFCASYMREQVLFQQTGEYPATAKGFAEVQKQVYENGERMRHYMVGLLLSFVLFPHHYRELLFFREHFARHLLGGGMICECGFGHGLWLATTLGANPDLRGVGFDVSPHCLDIAGRVLDRSGILPDRYILTCADVVDPATELPTGCRGIIAAGLLEHIEDPGAFLVRAAQLLSADEGRMFIMAPTNLAHPDHLVLFRTTGDIKVLFPPAGLTVERELTIPLPEFEGQSIYLAVLKRN